MAHIRKFRKKWQAIIRRKGIKTITKSFVSKAECSRWAKQIEVKLDRGDYSDYSEANKLILGDLFKRFINEGKHKSRKHSRMYEYRLKILSQDTIADVNLLRLSSKHLAEFKDRKRSEVGTSTYNKYLSLISVVVQTAMDEWGIYLPLNPCRLAKREREPNPRDRTLDGDEKTRLIEACVVSNKIDRRRKAGHIYLKAMVEFSIETAVRQGELLAMKYEHFDFEKRTLLIPHTKSGKPRTIPLTERAILVIKSVPRRFDGIVFPVTVDTLKSIFKTAKRHAKIKDLRWHDLRRFACSEFFRKGLNVAEIQLISGHADPKILLNTYTKLSAETIAIKLMKGGD